TTFRQLDTRTRAIGIVGRRDLGLAPFKGLWTQHEGTQIIGGLEPRSLPDRWQGLAMLQALVWSSETAVRDPGAMSEDSRAALREWVRRGGHLVIVLPAEGRGDLWT